MSRSNRQWLDDVRSAVHAIRSHVERGTLADGLVFDAVRIRLLEIGEAVKCIDVDILAQESSIPWRDIAGMRDVLAHRYFDTAHSVIQHTLDHEIQPLLEAVERILRSLED